MSYNGGMESKKCSLCGQTKPLSEYYRYLWGTKGPIARCKECLEKKHKEYRDKNKIKWTEYRIKHREKRNERERMRYQGFRQRVLEHYGNKCACCGETEPLFLEMDHIKNDGHKHRKDIGTSAKALVYWLIQNDFPEGYQILCANCNQGKKRNKGICPHKKEEL